MDPVSGLKGEVYRPLATVLVPGVFASTPVAIILLSWFPVLQNVFASPLATGVLVLGVGVLVGMVLENIGSTIEMKLWRFVETEERNRQWREYLQLSDVEEIVGQRYLRTVLVRLKFELSMIPALVVFGVGITLANAIYGDVSPIVMTWLLIILTGAVVYFVYEAYKSIKVLADVRADIIASTQASRIGELE